MWYIVYNWFYLHDKVAIVHIKCLGCTRASNLFFFNFFFLQFGTSHFPSLRHVWSRLLILLVLWTKNRRKKRLYWLKKWQRREGGGGGVDLEKETDSCWRKWDGLVRVGTWHLDGWLSARVVSRVLVHLFLFKIDSPVSFPCFVSFTTLPISRLSSDQTPQFTIFNYVFHFHSFTVKIL